MIDKQASCEDEHEPALLPVAEARRRLMQDLTPVPELEQIPLKQAARRILASDLSSPMNVPAQANSAMDGYAISRVSIPSSGTATMPVVGTAWAGKPYSDSVEPGQAVRIFTGAILPTGTDTVVIQEHVEAVDDSITIDHLVEPLRNVRSIGEDVRSLCIAD